MKILVIGKYYVEAFARHIQQTLEHMRHEVVVFEPGVDRQPKATWLRRKYEAVTTHLDAAAEHFSLYRRVRLRGLMDLASQAQPDLIISCYDYLRPDEVARLKDLTRAKIVLWYPDALINFGRSQFMVAPYDALFFKDSYVVDRLDGVVRAPVFYLPQCFNPLVHRAPASGETAEDQAYRCDITTAGNMYAYRVAFFEHLADYDVKLWGNPLPAWIDSPSVRAMHQETYVVEEEKARAFRAAKIVLNNMHPAEIWGVNCRAFEVAGVGGFLMLDWKPGLGQLFEDGHEVVTFTDLQDLRAKIDRYLGNPDARQRIARAGERRARREHTFEHRLTLLIDTVFAEADGFPRPRIEAPSLKPPRGG